jgi:hypothetical protein
LVGHQPLELSILVRVQVPEPLFLIKDLDPPLRSLNPETAGAARLAAFHASNKNIKPDIVVNGVEGRHCEGGYCLNHRGGWVDVGALRWTRGLNARTSAAPMAVLAIRRKFRELLVF